MPSNPVTLDELELRIRMEAERVLDLVWYGMILVMAVMLGCSLVLYGELAAKLDPKPPRYEVIWTGKHLTVPHELAPAMRGFEPLDGWSWSEVKP